MAQAGVQGSVGMVGMGQGLMKAYPTHTAGSMCPDDGGDTEYGVASVATEPSGYT